ncbi:MAG: hypothetical protein KAX65_15465 [Caldilineaceae bacterium]|nr:hypothetical protein [Caldilineaceae bacterium]
MSEPKKNTAFTFAIGLGSRLARPAFQAAPTLAAGDFKVSIDGGAFTNLATLPTVTPAGGTRVQIAMSAAEMNGDNIMVQCIDAAGGEWDDVIITFDLSVRNADDLATPTNITAGVITTVTHLTNAPTAGDLTAAMKTSVTTAATAATPTAAAVTGAVGSVTGAVGSVTAGVTVATNNDKTGYGLSSAAVQAIWDALTSALTTVGSIGKWIVDKLDIAVSTRLATAGYTAPLDAAGTRTAVGLATANLDTQLGDLPTNAELTTALGTADDAVLAQVALVKAKTDLIPASFPTNFSATVISATGDVSVDVNKINGVTIIGDGSATPFNV